jgi:class 3 adenylate cyclase
MLRSIVVKNVLLFLVILVVAVVPLSWQYYRDSRDAEIQTLASKLEFFAERGATWLDVPAVMRITGPEHKASTEYAELLATLKRITREFDVDNAVVLRRGEAGRYVYVAIDHGEFDPGDPAHIHDLFPATYTSTEDTWQAGEMMHSQLFGGRVEGTEYAQFLQINTPIKRDGKVVAILMLNKFADPVAAAVRMKTMQVTALSVGLFAIGLALFAALSARMLRPLKTLTSAADEVAQGNLAVALPAARSRDEVGRLSESFAGMLDGLKQRDFIRDTFGRYISKEVVDTLLGSPDGLRLGGDRREITLLVSDLRGFTSLAGRLPPEEVIRILNRYLERVVEILTRYRATVDEFQGDGILAFFGAPLAAPDDAERAVACAIEMQRALVALNDEQRAAGLPALEMGIGINTGEVIVGNIGSEQRTKYGAVGAAINLAYRIESQTVGGQVLVGPRTYELVRDVVEVRATLEVALKGVDTPLQIHDVVAVRGAHATALGQRTEEARIPLEPPVGITCYRLDGKRLSDAPLPGCLRAVAPTTAEISVEGALALRESVRIVVEGMDAYAKVLDPGAGGDAVVAFTDVSPALRRWLAGRLP